MADMPKPPIGKFFIQSLDEGTLFEADLGDGAPIITEGYAGWRTVDRPRDISIVEWAGRVPFLIEIPFFLDYYMEEIKTGPGINCEQQVSNLETLCGVGGHARPPICRVNGRGLIPHDEDSAGRGVHQWVIEQVEWDRTLEVRARTTGRRLQCGGNVSIRKFVEARDILKRISPTARAVVPKNYRVKAGDTLSKIAAKMYGDASKWKIIADANHIRDRRRLRVNQVLKIPQL